MFILVFAACEGLSLGLPNVSEEWFNEVLTCVLILQAASCILGSSNPNIPQDQLGFSYLPVSPGGMLMVTTFSGTDGAGGVREGREDCTGGRVWEKSVCGREEETATG